MTPTYRVLSLDWDYFIAATADQRIRLFPDGGNENLPGVLSDFIWASKYAENSELQSIEEDAPAINYILNFIRQTCDGTTKMFVYDSHKWAYNCITEYKPIGHNLQVINVDFHHDCYTMNEGIDCGNWLINLVNLPDVDKFQAIWVKRPDSDDCYCIDDVSFIKGKVKNGQPEFLQSAFIGDLYKFKKLHFDMVYICRSSCWSAPHLDSAFLGFCNLCRKYINGGYFMEDDLEDRYNSNFIHNVQETAKAYQFVKAQCIKEHNNNEKEHERA